MNWNSQILNALVENAGHKFQSIPLLRDTLTGSFADPQLVVTLRNLATDSATDRHGEGGGFGCLGFVKQAVQGRSKCSRYLLTGQMR
jgi:hypothetical protein